MSVIIANHTGLSQSLDTSNIVTFFTSNNTFSALYGDIGGIQTLGDICGGVLDVIRDRNLKKYLFHISNIPNTNRAFCAEKFYYKMDNNTFYWMQPININYNNTEIYDILFYNKTISKKLDILGERPLKMIYILSNSSKNRNYYRAHICNTIFKQNPDIQIFKHNLVSFKFPITEISSNIVSDIVHVYRPNQTIHYKNIINHSIYIPLIHNQEWFEIQTSNKNILLQNNLHHNFVIRIYEHNKNSINFIHKDVQYFILEDTHIIYSKKGFYGFFISTSKIIDDKVEFNKSFKEKYGSLIRQRPLRYNI